MYCEFFGVRDFPFRSTPDLDYFYNDASRGDIVNAIMYSLERGDGIVKVVGEVGSGKTTILRQVSKLFDDKYYAIFINSPNLPPMDILLFICHEFGIDASDTPQKFVLIHRLRELFINQHALGKRCVIMIDEAQSMPIETLEEVRLLSNLETEHSKLVQILLFGQPELDDNLSQPEIRQLSSRISHSIVLPNLKSDDIQSYLNFRMHKAGYRGKDVFNAKVAKLIAKRSKGIIRAVHSLADSALMAAYADDAKLVKTSHLETGGGLKTHGLVFGLAGLLVLLMVLALYFHYLHDKSSPVAVAQQPTGVLSKLADIINHDENNHEEILTNNTVLEQPVLPDTLIENTVKMNDAALINETSPIIGINGDINGGFAEMQQDDLAALLANEELLLLRQADVLYLNNLKAELLARQEEFYTIQVITGGVSNLKHVLTEIKAHFASEDVFWLINRPSYTLYFGFFSEVSQATEALAMLPNSYARGKPIVIRSERVINRIDRLLASLETE